MEGQTQSDARHGGPVQCPNNESTKRRMRRALMSLEWEHWVWDWPHSSPCAVCAGCWHKSPRPDISRGKLWTLLCGWLELKQEIILIWRNRINKVVTESVVEFLSVTAKLYYSTLKVLLLEAVLDGWTDELNIQTRPRWFGQILYLIDPPGKAGWCVGWLDEAELTKLVTLRGNLIDFNSCPINQYNLQWIPCVLFQGKSGLARRNSLGK